MRIKTWIVAAALCTGLAACGDTLGEQAIIGGAAGVGASAVTGGDPLTGGLVGAGANVAYCQSNPRACN